MKYIVIVAIFIIVGLVISISGLVFLLRTKALIKNGIKTLATITNKEKKKSDTLAGANEFPVIYYSYELTYTDYLENTIKKVSDFGDQTNLPVGDKIEIIYDKNKTDSFVIFAKKQEFFYLFLFILGVIFIVIGIVVMFQTRNMLFL